MTRSTLKISSANLNIYSVSLLQVGASERKLAPTFLFLNRTRCAGITDKKYPPMLSGDILAVGIGNGVKHNPFAVDFQLHMAVAELIAVAGAEI